MKLPSNVRVGPHLYSIEYVTTLKAPEDNTRLHGRHIYPELLIQIEALDHLSVKQETLLHEILHAVFDASGIDCQQEEIICTAFAPILLNIIKTNPKLINFLET